MAAALAALLVAVSPGAARAAGDEAGARQEYGDALRRPADSEQGARYFQGCAKCHGAQGQGSGDALVPRIAGQHYSVILRQLSDFRHARRLDDRMRAATADHVLPDAQALADVATFVNLLRLQAPISLGDGSRFEEGAHLFGANCASCHGAAAEGSDRRAVPRLAGQNYAYLVRQLHDIVEGRRPNISRRHVKLLEPLDYQEISALADYLSNVMTLEARSTRRSLP